MGMFSDIYEAVKKIPRGYVASYGYVSRLAGHPRGAKYVGWALHQNPEPGVIPCHRVVKKDGSLSESFRFGGINMQEKLLSGEGVEIADGKADMTRFSLDVLEPLV